MKNAQESWLGACDVYFDDVEVGLMGPTVTVRYRTPREELLAPAADGGPEQSWVQVIVEEHYEAEFDSFQLTAAGAAKMAGNLTVETIAGSPVTVADGDNIERTFAAGWLGAPGYQSIELPGPNWGTLVVKDITEATTYTAGTHYLHFKSLLNNDRVVLTTASGAPASGATVRIHGQYTPPASERLNFGAQHVLVPIKLEIRGKNRVTGKTEQHIMWRALNNEGSLEFNYESKAFRQTKGFFKAMPDPTKTTNPLGYFNRNV